MQSGFIRKGEDCLEIIQNADVQDINVEQVKAEAGRFYAYLQEQMPSIIRNSRAFFGTRRFLMPPVESESTVKRMVRNKAETMETVSSFIP